MHLQKLFLFSVVLLLLLIGETKVTAAEDAKNPRDNPKYIQLVETLEKLGVEKLESSEAEGFKPVEIGNFCTIECYDVEGTDGGLQVCVRVCEGDPR